MLESLDLVTLAGVLALGLVHGAEPGHGWPIAATYALDSTRKWTMGLVASLVIGVGHLISSLAVVAVFFLAKAAFDVTQLWWLNEAAGILLVLLGIHEYRHGHSHSPRDGTHSQGDDGEQGTDRRPTPAHPSKQSGSRRVSGVYDDPAVDVRRGGFDLESGATASTELDGHGHGDEHGHSHTHSHGSDLEAGAERGLWGLASAAFVLGFAHEEEFEIIGICAGTDACLSLMVAYALAVISSLVALTLLLVAGYNRYEERVEQVAPHFSTISAVVLVAMGVLFIVDVL